MSLEHTQLASDELYAVFRAFSTPPPAPVEEQKEELPLTLDQKLNVRPRIHKLSDDSTIEYGFSASNLPQHTEETFYLTTAINYTNGFPHIGHAYEV